MKNAFFALTAAAVMSISTNASAGHKPVTITLDGYCDTFTVTNSNGVYSIADDPSTCTTWYGTGIKAKADGKIASFGMITPGQASTAYFVTFSYPFTTGGTFNMYITNDGLNGDGFLALTDTYSVAGTPNQGQRGTKSAINAVKH